VRLPKFDMVVVCWSPQLMIKLLMVAIIRWMRLAAVARRQLGMRLNQFRNQSLSQMMGPRLLPTCKLEPHFP